MATFQKTHPHEDNVPKRALTEKDLAFLTSLQHTLNTQDGMGNKDPRFWVIRQTKERPSPEDDADQTVAVFVDDYTTYYDMNELAAAIDHICFDEMTVGKLSDGTYRLTANGRDASDVSCIEDAIDYLQDSGIYKFELRYISHVETIVPDTLFLTHAACEDHLRKYHYNYAPDAHAYAMTADRSPQFAELLSILQSIDWTALRAALPSQQQKRGNRPMSIMQQNLYPELTQSDLKNGLQNGTVKLCHRHDLLYDDVDRILGRIMRGVRVPGEEDGDPKTLTVDAIGVSYQGKPVARIYVSAIVNGHVELPKTHMAYTDICKYCGKCY